MYKTIPEYPTYSITEYGDIYSNYKRDLKNTYFNNNGYECCKLYKNNRQYTVLVHRAVARVWGSLPSLDSDLEVDHDDGILEHNWNDNLVVMTREAHQEKTIISKGLNIWNQKYCISCGSRIDPRNTKTVCAACV